MTLFSLIDLVWAGWSEGKLRLPGPRDRSVQTANNEEEVVELYHNFPPKMGHETNPEATLIALRSLTHFLKNPAIASPRSLLHSVS